MRSKLNFFSDEKFRSIFFQTLVIGLFALGIFFIVQTTAYNLEKRNIATGWRFLTDPAGFDICLLYTSPSPRDATLSRMPSSA